MEQTTQKKSAIRKNSRLIAFLIPLDVSPLWDALPLSKRRIMRDKLVEMIKETAKKD